MLKVITVLLLLVGFFHVLVASLILLRSPKRILNIAFFITTLSSAAWIFGIAGFYLVQDAEAAIKWAKFYYIAPLILFAACTVLADLFPRGDRYSKKRLVIISVWLLAIILPMFIIPGYLTQRIVYHDWGKEVVLDRAHYLIYVLYISFCFASILQSIIATYKREVGIYKDQVRVFASGIIISSIFGTFFNLYLPIFGNYRLIWIGPILTSIYIFVTSYGILKHRLFDIRLVLARSLAYAFTLSILASLYGFVIFGIAKTVFGLNIDLVAQIVLSIVTAIVGLSFQRIKMAFDKLSTRIFYHDAYEPQELFDQLNKVLVSTVDLNHLMRQTSTVIAQTLKADYCAIGLAHETWPSVRIIGSKEVRFSEHDIAATRRITPHIHKSVIDADSLSATYPELKELMDSNNVSVIVRLSPHLQNLQEGIGYLILGPKRSGSPYTENDFRVLDTLSKELIIAIQNALRFEEIASFNTTLQQKVDEQTRKLRKTNEKLKEMDETKDDFISMASHQLRTPLTSVKGYISMVLEEDAGKITPAQREMLSQAFFSSQRMVYLIADLLNVSRLKTGKFVIETVPVNLADMIEQELQQLQETAAARNLTLQYDKPVDFPTLQLDETKMRQVIMNFVDNAIYYTPAGGHIRVELQEKPATIEMRVIDDGIGVAKHEQPHLFTKFYRAGNARKARPDGTGLGLFMAKKVIIAQGGSLIFESTEGKGSTFGFVFAKSRLVAEATALPPAEPVKTHAAKP